MSEEIRKNSDCLNRRLLAYTTAAGAALVAVGAAEAGVHHTLVPEPDGEFTVGDPLPVTLEGESPDFTLSAIDGDYVALAVQDPASIFAVVGSPLGGDGGPVLVSMLSSEEMIGENSSTMTYHSAIFQLSYLGKNGEPHFLYGDWENDGDTGFFGFSFVSEETEDTLFGWGRLQRVNSTTGRLIDWAYEDSGDPIAAGYVPEPGSLALLALGAAGIASMRKRRTEV